MLESVLMHLKNWFLTPNGVCPGRYIVQNGEVIVPGLQENQYFRICGSVFNDGLHKYPAKDLKDEEFDGVIWALAVPQAVVDLAEEIGEWQKKNGDAATSPYQSESFGGYSYSKASNGAGDIASVTWQGVFKSRLDPFRRVREV